MKFLKIAAALAVTATLIVIPFRSAMSADDEYSFKVHNTTKDKITKLLASEDGEEYGAFDVGKAGIAPGKTMTLKWDKMGGTREVRSRPLPSTFAHWSEYRRFPGRWPCSRRAARASGFRRRCPAAAPD